MFKTARRLIALTLVGGGALAAVVAWSTGSLHKVQDQAMGGYHQAVDFVTHLDLMHAVGGLVVVGLPLIVILMIMDSR